MSQSILIVGPSWIGDMIMAQSLFIALKNQSPDVSIDVLAPAWTRPLLARMPEVRDGFDMPVGHGKLQLDVRKDVAKSLRQRDYDQAIVLPNSLKSALIPWFAKIPKRTGWRGEMRYGLLNDIRKLDKRRYPLMVERFVALAHPKGKILPRELPRPRLVVEGESCQAALSALNLTNDKPILVLCPGAEYGPAKRWPAKYYGDIAKMYLERDFNVWVMGSEKEAIYAEQIRALAPEAIDLCGKTNLGQAIDLMSLAQTVVSNDSGLMHMAAALDRNIVAIYGSSSPNFTPPLSDKVQILSLGLDCSPCFKRDCPLQHTNCLNKLMPAQISAAIDNFKK